MEACPDYCKPPPLHLQNVKCSMSSSRSTSSFWSLLSSWRLLVEYWDMCSVINWLDNTPPLLLHTLSLLLPHRPLLPLWLSSFLPHISLSIHQADTVIERATNFTVNRIRSYSKQQDLSVNVNSLAVNIVQRTVSTSDPPSFTSNPPFLLPAPLLWGHCWS